jgi:hypothetical protein
VGNLAHLHYRDSQLGPAADVGLRWPMVVLCRLNSPFRQLVADDAELAKIKVSDTLNYAHPVVAGKRIFVKDQDALTMWTLE